MNTEVKTKMKLWKKILIGVGGTLTLLGIIIAIILIWDIPLIVLFIIGGISLIVWVIISTILIYQKIKKKEPEVIKVNLEDLRELVKYKMKYDEDNPDNFIIYKQIPVKIGEPGSERTLIWKFIGKGTELNQDRVVLVNAKNTNEMAFLVDPTEKEIIEVAIGMAEHQPDITTREIIPGGIDEFGRPIPTRVKITSQSRAEVKEEKEKEEAEKQVAF